jgi:hypothetical protein
MLKNKRNLILLAILVLIASGCSSLIVEDTIIIEENTLNNEYGSFGALEDPEFTIEEMLTYAIQDEYLAKTEYELIVQEFEIAQPFTNIIRSEETHIQLLLPLFDAYAIDVTANTAENHIVLPETLKEVFEIAVQAEINNIAMYDLFLREDLPEDLRTSFVFLRDASESHLAAFQNNLNRYQ